MPKPTTYTVLYEYLGGSQTFTMPQDYDDFAREVVQDYQAADELLSDLLEEGVVMSYGDDWIERFTLEP